MILSKDFLDSFLAGAISDEPDAGLLDGAFLRLYKNDHMPHAGSTLDSFTQADFTGYPTGGVELENWTAPVNESTNQRKLVGQSVTFTQTADTVTNTVYGYYIVNDTTLLVAKRFDEPAEFGRAGANLTIVPALSLSQSVADADVVDHDA